MEDINHIGWAFARDLKQVVEKAIEDPTGGAEALLQKLNQFRALMGRTIEAEPTGTDNDLDTNRAITSAVSKFCWGDPVSVSALNPDKVDKVVDCLIAATYKNGLVPATCLHSMAFRKLVRCVALCCFAGADSEEARTLVKKEKWAKKVERYMEYVKELKKTNEDRREMADRFSALAPELTLLIFGEMVKSTIPSVLRLEDKCQSFVLSNGFKVSAGKEKNTSTLTCIRISLLRPLAEISLERPSGWGGSGFKYEDDEIQKKLGEVVEEAIIEATAILMQANESLPKSLSPYITHIQRLYLNIFIPFSTVDVYPKELYKTYRSIPALLQGMPSLKEVKLDVLEGPRDSSVDDSTLRGRYLARGYGLGFTTIERELEVLAGIMRGMDGKAKRLLCYYDEDKVKEDDWTVMNSAMDRKQVDMGGVAAEEVARMMVEEPGREFLL